LHQSVRAAPNPDRTPDPPDFNHALSISTDSPSSQPSTAPARVSPAASYAASRQA
jgi:hypothetical protein